MKTIKLFFTIGLLNLLIPGCQHNSRDFSNLKGPYLGQVRPDSIPMAFASGFISTGMNEVNSVFSTNGNEFYFSVFNSGMSSIFRTVLNSKGWSNPTLLPFASIYGDIDISISPDGKNLFYCSKRPIYPHDSSKTDHDIWMCNKVNDSWSEPINLGSKVNSFKEDYYPTTARNGNLYFSSQRVSPGTNNIFVSRFTGGEYMQAEQISSEVNIGTWNFDPYIDPDEKFIIFASNKEGGFGQSDLYISFRNIDGSWSMAKNMGNRINSSESEFSPMITPDGKYLFFTSSRLKTEKQSKPQTYREFEHTMTTHQNGSTDIYWIDAKIIEKLRPRE